MVTSAASSIVLARIRQTTCRLLAVSCRNNGRSTLRVLGGAPKAPSPQSWRALSSVEAVTTTSDAPKEEKPIIPGVGKGKTSTGVTGLAVEPDWYNVMLKKFQLLLDTLEQSDMPETAQYRIDVTKWASFVIATVKANPDDPETVEHEVRMGQVEELIEMADDEMICMKEYIKSRVWEMIDMDGEGPEVDFNPNPMKDEMAPDSDPRTRKIIEEDLRAMMMAGLEDDDEDEDEEYKDPEEEEQRKK